MKSTNHPAYIKNEGKGLQKYSLVRLKRIRKLLKIEANTYHFKVIWQTRLYPIETKIGKVQASRVVMGIFKA